MKSLRNSQKAFIESHDLGITRSAGVDLTLEDIKAISASVCVQSEMVEGSIHNPKGTSALPYPAMSSCFCSVDGLVISRMSIKIAVDTGQRRISRTSSRRESQHAFFHK